MSNYKSYYTAGIICRQKKQNKKNCK